MASHATLKRMIDKHGTSVTFKSFTQGTYNVSTGVVSGTEVTYTVKAYFYDYKLEEIDGSNVIYGDRRVLMSLVDTSGTAIASPQAGDTISGLGGTVKVKGLSTIVDATPVCYLVHVGE